MKKKYTYVCNFNIINDYFSNNLFLFFHSCNIFGNLRRKRYIKFQQRDDAFYVYYCCFLLLLFLFSIIYKFKNKTTCSCYFKREILN